MTENNLRIRPYPLGAHKEEGGIRFSFVSKTDQCGVILYDRVTGKKLRKVPFPTKNRIGNIHYQYISGIEASAISYQFYEEEYIVADNYARIFVNKNRYGLKREPKDLKAGFLKEDFDWEKDARPKIPYEDCICYCMHVRGFTKHISSGAKYRGTFRGVIEKLLYLKELGITTIELQPAYEFLEFSTEKEPEKKAAHLKKELDKQKYKSADFIEKEQKIPDKINYWGYKQGYYYAPKSGYSAGEDASVEFKEMIKAFHKNHMEVIMQFYFPKEVLRTEILEILHFWVWEYHIDGFHLMGEQLPIEMIAADAALTDTKLWYYNFQTEVIYGKELPDYRNLAVYRDDYMYEMRRFLKGDNNMLNSALYFMRQNPAAIGQINYFTNYYGFTMMDLVSYDYKHNEENGEDNRDGNDYNHSWNCGFEGISRRKYIQSRRFGQIKNALSILFLSQATPLIFMGDEFGNSQKGNNNPYCQDNEITWLNWKDKERNQELYQFTKELIALRKAHPILHQSKEMQIMDWISCGYPDLSYHGEAAWRPALDNYNRHVGIMYCGKYASIKPGKEDNFFYIAINMHWERHKFAMPRLPKGMKWELVFQTVKEQNILEEEDGQQMREILPRSIAVYKSKEENKKKKNRKKIEKKKEKG